MKKPTENIGLNPSNKKTRWMIAGLLALGLACGSGCEKQKTSKEKEVKPVKTELQKQLNNLWKTYANKIKECKKNQECKKKQFKNHFSRIYKKLCKKNCHPNKPMSMENLCRRKSGKTKKTCNAQKFRLNHNKHNPNKLKESLEDL